MEPSLSLLSPPISPFLSFPLLLPSPSFSLRFPSPSLVHVCGGLPTLSSCPSLQNMSESYTEGWLQRMKCEIQNDESWLSASWQGCVSWCRDPKVTLFEDSNEMQQNWARAPLWDGAALWGSAASSVFYHSANIIRFMLLTNSACFFLRDLFVINQLIMNTI